MVFGVFSRLLSSSSNKHISFSTFWPTRHTLFIFKITLWNKPSVCLRQQIFQSRHDPAVLHDQVLCLFHAYFLSPFKPQWAGSSVLVIFWDPLHPLTVLEMWSFGIIMHWCSPMRGYQNQQQRTLLIKQPSYPLLWGLWGSKVKGTS